MPIYICEDCGESYFLPENPGVPVIRVGCHPGADTERTEGGNDAATDEMS